MFIKNPKFIFIIFAAIFGIALILPAPAYAQQKRDSLTPEEIELVRDAQAIDARTEIFVKAIDRRLLVLNNQTAPDDKKSKKDAEKWGALPVGTRLQLLIDIKKILDEAIGNIDDVAAHDKMDEKLFPKAVRRLAEAAKGYLPQFKSAFDATDDEKEKGAILSSIEFCEQIIEASAKLSKSTEKGK